jgi:hypothetical protein
MILHAFIFPINIIFIEEIDNKTSLTLQDTSLKSEIPSQERTAINFNQIIKWMNTSAKISLGTTEVELFSTKDYGIFEATKSGDLMEAYGLLYRLRWVRYRTGRPNYELTHGKDGLDALYAPQDDFQKRRFTATNSFINLFDKMNSKDREAILAGKPLQYSDLSPQMQGAFRGAVDAVVDDTIASSASDGKTLEKPDTVKIGEITIKDETKEGTGIREMTLSFDSNFVSSTFRWNNYDSKKSNFTYARPVASLYDPEPDETFSRKKMLAKYKKLATLVSVPKEKRTLASLLKYLSTRYKINFLTSEDRKKKPVVFSCENIPLSEALDKISKAYGEAYGDRSKEQSEWEWEASAGDFIVMRSPDHPRRRGPEAK